MVCTPFKTPCSSWRPGRQDHAAATQRTTVLASDFRSRFGRPSTRGGYSCQSGSAERQLYYWQANVNTPPLSANPLSSLPKTWGASGYFLWGQGHGCPTVFSENCVQEAFDLSAPESRIGYRRDFHCDSGNQFVRFHCRENCRVR